MKQQSSLVFPLFSYYVFQKMLKQLEQEEQGIDRFTSAYKQFGIHVDDRTNEIHIQEWAPGAKAMYIRGDFSMFVVQYDRNVLSML
jgi:hypothetical protein